MKIIFRRRDSNKLICMIFWVATESKICFLSRLLGTCKLILHCTPFLQFFLIPVLSIRAPLLYPQNLCQQLISKSFSATKEYPVIALLLEINTTIWTKSIGCIYEVKDDGSNILVPIATSSTLSHLVTSMMLYYFIFLISSVGKSFFWVNITAVISVFFPFQ